MPRRQLRSRNVFKTLLTSEPHDEHPQTQQTTPKEATEEITEEITDEITEEVTEEDTNLEDTIDPELVKALKQILQEAETLYDDDTYCPRCHRNWTCKRGKTETGKQRYWCKHCKRSYQEGANIRTRKIRLDPETYTTYLICFLQRRTVREIAGICDISTTRALKIRHIILDALERTNEGNHQWRNHEDVEMFMEKFHGVNPENFKDYLQYYDLIEKN